MFFVFEKQFDLNRSGAGCLLALLIIFGKMIVVVTKTLVAKGFNGFTFFPFVFIRDKELMKDPFFMNHEKIHLRQQLELLVVFFYIWYVLEYAYHFLILKNSYLAYKSISFEKEAYAKEKDLSYLEERSWFGFLNDFFYRLNF